MLHVRALLTQPAGNSPAPVGRPVVRGVGPAEAAVQLARGRVRGVAPLETGTDVVRGVYKLAPSTIASIVGLGPLKV